MDEVLVKAGYCSNTDRKVMIILWARMEMVEMKKIHTSRDRLGSKTKVFTNLFNQILLWFNQNIDYGLIIFHN